MITIGQPTASNQPTVEHPTVDPSTVTGSLGSGTAVDTTSGTPYVRPDGVTVLPKVVVRANWGAYADWVHADSYGLYGSMLNLFGVPVLGDLSNAYRAGIYGNTGERNGHLAWAAFGALLQRLGGSSSRTLGRNLAEAGFWREAGDAAHHIVAGNAQAAAEARAILANLGIGINEAANGAFVPTVTHWSMHTKAYYEAVTEALLGARTREEAIEILAEIRQGIQNGTFP